MQDIKFRDNLITYDTLKESGYKRYIDNSGSGNVALWTKKIRDQFGIKYIITFKEFDWTKYPNNYFHDTSFESYVQFDKDDDNVVNVIYLQTGEPIIKIEEFFESMWIKMQFSYNEQY